VRELAKGCITRPTVRRYLGFAHGRRKRLQEPDPTVKHLLSRMSCLLSGIRLMRHGEVVSNLHVSNETFRDTAVNELIFRKREGSEKERLNPAELAVHANGSTRSK
jgi:hypothetical protein